MVEVSKEVYNVCFSSYVKELRNNRKKQAVNENRLDYVDIDGHILIELIPAKQNIERDVSNKIMHEIILEEIRQLNDEDRKIILDSVVEEKSL